ncbi:BON domain-containing protein [Granulicella aggregans]|uniref:BON domain-containing protein n=1 Tax=Granulicella aggregans TaxID=474949 RepID=UPI0021DF7D3C|nr:BON domain-containing protein [Granulicella aggregans]
MKTAAALKHDVEQELSWEPSVNADKIGVSINNGVVELDGHVDSFYQKWAAEQAALRACNVTAIASEIKVDLPFENERADEQIAAAASDHLEWNLQVPESVKVKVADGWLTLSGTVEWQFQKAESERVVRSLRGVKAVINEIQLTPKVSAVGVKVKIEDAIKRDAQLSANSIKVETNGTKVTLRGRVHSWSELQDAEHAAYDAPGVSSVSNLIEIGS